MRQEWILQRAENSDEFVRTVWAAGLRLIFLPKPHLWVITSEQLQFMKWQVFNFSPNNDILQARGVWTHQFQFGCGV